MEINSGFRFESTHSGGVLKCGASFGIEANAAATTTAAAPSTTASVSRVPGKASVLAPEQLAVEQVAGRAERIDLECLFNIPLVPLFNALGSWRPQGVLVPEVRRHRRA